mgnify:CR=1 FL=1
MKKNYFLVALFALALTSVNAQFSDDMESYPAGSTIYGDWWTDWGCGGTCAGLASDAYAQSGSISFNVDGSGMDPVLDFGNKIFGSNESVFSMHITKRLVFIDSFKAIIKHRD